MLTLVGKQSLSRIEIVNRRIYLLAKSIGATWYPDPLIVIAALEKEAAKKGFAAKAANWTIGNINAITAALLGKEWLVFDTDENAQKVLELRLITQAVLAAAVAEPKGYNRRIKIALWKALEGCANQGDLEYIEIEIQRFNTVEAPKLEAFAKARLLDAINAGVTERLARSADEQWLKENVSYPYDFLKSMLISAKKTANTPSEMAGPSGELFTWDDQAKKAAGLGDFVISTNVVVVGAIVLGVVVLVGSILAYFVINKAVGTWAKAYTQTAEAQQRARDAVFDAWKRSNENRARKGDEPLPYPADPAFKYPLMPKMPYEDAATVFGYLLLAGAGIYAAVKIIPLFTKKQN